MAVTLNETPSANRLHIGIFGKTNSGKSSFLSTLFPAAETFLSWYILQEQLQNPWISPWKFILWVPAYSLIQRDLLMRGNLELSAWRKRDWQHRKQMRGSFFFPGRDMKEELDWFRYFKEKNTPVIPVLSKADTYEQEEKSFLISQIKKETGVYPSAVSAL